jgi:hypothetical protein
MGGDGEMGGGETGGGSGPGGGAELCGVREPGGGTLGLRGAFGAVPGTAYQGSSVRPRTFSMPSGWWSSMRARSSFGPSSAKYSSVQAGPI